MVATFGHEVARPGVSAPIDVKKLIESRLLIQANSGGGKSWAVRRLLEQTHGMVQHFVMDPEGEFVTLREKFPYVVASKHGGDCVADPRSAALLAHKLLEMGTSAVLDLYELRAHDRIMFVRNFLDALVNAPKSLWHPAIVVLDEAHVFAPQVGSAESSGAVIDLATRGRKRGFCLVAATQRISKLHKDVAAECNNKLIGRSSLDVDMKRSADELGFGGLQAQHALRRKKPGQFFAFGPALADEVTEITVGPVKTLHPLAGKRSVKTPPPPAAIRKVLAQLADLPKEAEEEIRNLTEARAKIRDLERQLKQTPTPKVERVVEKAPQPFMDAKHVRSITAVLSKFVELAPLAAEAADKLRTARNAHIAQELRNNLKMPPRAEVKPAPAGEIVYAPPRVGSAKEVDIKDDGVSLTPGKQKILNAIAWWRVLGNATPSRLQVSLKLGVGATSGGFTNNLGAMKTAGLIDYPGSGLLQLTPAGEVLASFVDAATIEDLRAAVRSFVTPAQWRIIEVLIAVGLRSREDLAKHFDVGVTSGGFTNNLGRLHTLGLITYPSKGHVRAAPVLFGQ